MIHLMRLLLLFIYCNVEVRFTLVDRFNFVTHMTETLTTHIIYNILLYCEIARNCPLLPELLLLCLKLFPILPYLPPLNPTGRRNPTLINCAYVDLQLSKPPLYGTSTAINPTTTKYAVYNEHLHQRSVCVLSLASVHNTTTSFSVSLSNINGSVILPRKRFHQH